MSASQAPLEWLSNPSFSESLLPTPIPTSEWNIEQDEGQKQPEEQRFCGDVGQLLSTSSQDSKEDDKQGRSTENKEGKKKRKKEKEHRHAKEKGKKKKKN